MPDLGDRANVMGPQPIAARRKPPAAMLEAGERVRTLLVEGNTEDVLAMTMPDARDSIASIAEAVKAGAYGEHQVIGMARTNNHYYVKFRLLGRDTPPFKALLRLGEHDGRWMVWEAINLTGVRSAWTK